MHCAVIAAQSAQRVDCVQNLAPVAMFGNHSWQWPDLRPISIAPFIQANLPRSVRGSRSACFCRPAIGHTPKRLFPTVYDRAMTSSDGLMLTEIVDRSALENAVELRPAIEAQRSSTLPRDFASMAQTPSQ